MDQLENDYSDFGEMKEIFNEGPARLNNIDFENATMLDTTSKRTDEALYFDIKRLII